MLQKENCKTTNSDSFQSLKVLSLKCIIHFILRYLHHLLCGEMKTHFSRKFHKMSVCENIEKLFSELIIYFG